MAGATWDWESRIGRRVRLRDLHILSAVVQSGSMAKAASHLAMSQSVVSEAISNLEAALRVRLLDRGPRGVEPTIYARALLKRGKVVFDELREGIKDIEFLANPTAGEVRIASPEFLLAWLLPTAIERLSVEYPGIFVRVFHTNATTVDFRALHERNVDLVIARVPADFGNDELNVEFLLEDQHFVVTGAQSQWARRRKVTLAELVNATWVLPPNPAIHAMLHEAFAAEGLKAPVERVTTASVLLRIHLVATGRFVTVFPTMAMRSVARQLSFRVLPVNLRVTSPPIVIIRLKNRTVSPVVELFTEKLREIAKAVPSRSERHKD
jgi:DNA-binding transcriptional LysR family regulator